MPGKLVGKKAPVTGGSRGIGAAIARSFAAEGADVAITFAANRQAAERVVSALRSSGVRGEAIQADGADPVAVKRAVGEATSALGGLDVLVHNAGISEFVSLVVPANRTTSTRNAGSSRSTSMAGWR